jgi:tripartite ATP-independent transporter DctM subunit
VYPEDLLPLLMFAALSVLLFTGYPVAFILGGLSLVFGGIGWWMGVFSPVEFYSFWPRMYGQSADNIVLVAVPMFIFMGIMLERSGIAERLLYCLQVLLRRVPGGLAIGITIMGTVLAATTGIIGASVVMMSLLAMPIMIQRGYSKALASGTIAASGTLGILIPPSIMLVVMADLLSISVGNLFLGAILPGLILAGLYLGYILIASAIRPDLAPPLPEDELLERGWALGRLVVTSFVPPVFLMVLVLGSIFAGFATPTEASGVGAAGAILLTWLNGNLHREVMVDVVARSAQTIGMIFTLILAATCFAYVFRALGGDFVVTEGIERLGLGPWPLLFTIMGVIFVLGFFFDWIEITLIVLPVFAPIVAGLDFGEHVAGREQLYWFAILIAVNLQNSFLTPPFGMALFFLKGTAPPEVRLQDIYRGIVPFVLLQLTGLGLLMAFPSIALWLPRLILE